MLKRGGMFDRVQTLRPGRSVFDLSYAKKMSGRMGYLYPMMVDEVVPGDVFEIGMEAVVRFAPMVAPVLHEIVMKADWFFVPYRLLGARDDFSSVDGATVWEKFITGGQNGSYATPLTRIDVGGDVEGQLLDHLGIPPGLTLTGDDRPLLFLPGAYNLIYNEYYRDPNLEALIPIDNKAIQYANWDPDYFTRALPWQQRGTAPAIPIQGTTTAAFEAGAFGTAATMAAMSVNNGAVDPVIYASGGAQALDNLKAAFARNTVNLASGVGVSISDLRLAVQLQRWMERNARSGYRYTEFLRAHFGISPRDDRLDRPEYIGGVRQPIVISEVLQTSQTGTTPQGNQAGHGILAGRHNVGRYHVKEYGLIMAIMSIIPRSAYQQGINRQWLRVSKYDFYHPEFANLSEQAIKNEEIYSANTAAGTNQNIFGYQGRYDEMRSKNDMVAGAFRSSLNYWHLGRIFGSLPALSSGFGHVDPTTVTRIFAVPSADHLYVHWGNRIKAIRPLPMVSNPGRMDHDYGGY